MILIRQSKDNSRNEIMKVEEAKALSRLHPLPLSQYTDPFVGITPSSIEVDYETTAKVSFESP